MRAVGRLSCIGVLVLVGLVPVGQAASLTFHAPAQIQAENMVVTTGLLVLVIPSESAWQAMVSNAHVISGVRYQFAELTTEISGVYESHRRAELQEVRGRTNWTDMTLTPQWGAASSVILEAERIQVDLASSAATVETIQGSWARDFAATNDHWELRAAAVHHARKTPIVYLQTPLDSPLQVTATDLQRIEWHGARPVCPEGQDCPDPSSEGNLIEFVEHRLGGGNLTMVARPRIAAAGAASTLMFDGTARLPRAVGEVDCFNCSLDEDALSVHGNVSLAIHDVLDEPGSWLVAELNGSYVLRINEDVVGMSLASAAVITMGFVAVLIAVLKVFSALISRHILDAPLKLPSRRIVYQVIESNPGIIGREVQRISGLANGVMRYHVALLGRAGLIHHWREGRSIHYAVQGVSKEFAMRDRLLAQPHVGQLLAEFGGGVWYSQSRWIAWGQLNAHWSRTTTQNKIRLLSRHGLIESRVEAGRKLYRIVV